MISKQCTWLRVNTFFTTLQAFLEKTILEFMRETYSIRPRASAENFPVKAAEKSKTEKSLNLPRLYQFHV